MMQRLVVVLLGLVVLAYVVAMTVTVDPEERRPGLTLSGDQAADQQLSYTGRKKIHVQTRTWYGIPHSVTTTSWLVDGIVHVPCGRCDAKRWPRNVAADNRVVLKIDGELYPRQAILISDDVERERVLGALGSENDLPPGVVVFRMEMPSV